MSLRIFLKFLELLEYFSWLKYQFSTISGIILIPKLINSENNKISRFSTNPQSPCAIILINLKGPCFYLLIGFNDYLGPLVKVKGATSISTIFIVVVDVRSSPPYIFVPAP